MHDFLEIKRHLSDVFKRLQVTSKSVLFTGIGDLIV